MRQVFTVTDGDHSTDTGPITFGMAVVSDPGIPYAPVVLQTLTIFPQFRGHGHGSKLLEIVRQHAYNEHKNLIVPTTTLDQDYPGAFGWLSDRGFIYRPAMNALVVPWHKELQNA